MPEHLQRDYWNQTTLHPLGLAALIALGVATLLLPRRYAVFPMIVMACFIPAGQRVVISTLDFTLLRLLVLSGLARVTIRQEWSGFRWLPIDTMMALWAVSSVLMYTAQVGDSSGFISKSGSMLDAAGMYFLIRALVRGWEDVVRIALMFVVVSVPVSIAFMVELSTQRNVFAVFGGVPEFTMMRDGRLRCQGAFSHPILAGCFWASVMPLVAGLWWWKRSRMWAVVGVGLGTMSLIVIACASSTPIMAVLTGLVGASFFVVRWWMRWVRWGLVGMLFSLHMVMKQPVWHLLARIDIVSGSTGWYRYVLIDGFIRHFDEWWLFGTESTAHWRGEAWDITNQYVWEGVQGGLLTLSLFLAVMTLAFRAVGRLRADAAARGDRRREIMAWALGVAMFVHTMNFFGVSYFGQIILVWNLLLAVIASLESGLKAPRPVRVAAPARPAVAGGRA